MSAPEEAPPHQAWLSMLSWMVCGLALVQLALLSMGSSRGSMLLTPLLCVAAVGACSITLRAVYAQGQRLKYWPWLAIALSCALQATQTAITVVAQIGYVPEQPLLQFTTSLLVSILVVVHGLELQRSCLSGASCFVQALADVGLISIAALVVMDSLVQSSVIGVFLVPNGTGEVTADALFLVGGVVFLAQRNRSKGCAWWIVAGLGCRLLARGFYASQTLGVTSLAFVAPPLEILSYGCIGRAAASFGAGVHTRRKAFAWSGSSSLAIIPWLSAMIAVASLAFAPTAPPVLILLLAGVGALRELIAAFCRRRAVLNFESQLHTEQRGRAADNAAAKEQFTQLARTLHDQGPPMNGVWRIQRELAQVKATTLADRLFTHLDVLQTLNDHARALLRGQMPTLRLRAVRIDMFTIAQAALDAAGERATISGVQLSLSVATAHTFVLGDPVAIRRILDNLLTNALDATPSGGVVVVELWEEQAHPEFLTLTVRDSGCGVSDEQQASIFAVPQQMRSGPGMGLGLSIVRELAEAMNGACGVTSAVGAGSAFWVRLPREHCGAVATKEIRQASQR